MTPEAEDAVAEFAADCGADIYKMKNSCETYLQQYLRNFPAEQELMIAALRVGVPARIAQVEDFSDYEAFLADLAGKFERAAHTDADAAKWTVGAWAFAVGKPMGYVPPEKAENDGRDYRDRPPPKYEGAVQAVMAGIVVAGGFLGSALGAGLPPLFIVSAFQAVDQAHGVERGDGDAVMTGGFYLFMLLVMAATGTVGALGALGGWMVGKGDDKPWTGFAVAFGTGFTTAMLLLFFVNIILKPFVLFGALFGATYKCATRGGH